MPRSASWWDLCIRMHVYEESWRYLKSTLGRWEPSLVQTDLFSILTRTEKTKTNSRTCNMVEPEIPKEDDPIQVNGEDLKTRIPKRHTTTVSQVPVPLFGKLSNPDSLGLIGFALTTFVLGFYQCRAGWVAATTTVPLRYANSIPLDCRIPILRAKLGRIKLCLGLLSLWAALHSLSRAFSRWQFHNCTLLLRGFLA